MSIQPSTHPAGRLLQRWLTVAALAAIGVFASENLFWSAPPGPLTPLDLLLTWLAHALATTASLMALTATRASGWLAIFLSGCIYGWLVEGVIVQTVLDAFPYTMVFTGMSWHALPTVLLVALGVRLSAGWPLWRQLAYLLALSALFSLWALYWPIERAPMPDPLTVAWYLCGLGLVVPLANMTLDHLPPTPQFSRWEIGIVAGLFTLAWLIPFVTTLDLRLLAVPAAIAATLGLLYRLRLPTNSTIPTTPPGQRWRHWLFMLVPAAVTLITTLFWPQGGLESNGIIAIATSLIAIGVYGAALVAALRPRW